MHHFVHSIHPSKVHQSYNKVHHVGDSPCSSCQAFDEFNGLDCEQMDEHCRKLWLDYLQKVEIVKAELVSSKQRLLRLKSNLDAVDDIIFELIAQRETYTVLHQKGDSHEDYR